MNLEKTLKVASHLARCGDAIKKLKDNQPLEAEEQSWVFNLFNINWDERYQEDRGKISFMLFEKANGVAIYLINLSKKISHNTLDLDDWKFILDGLIEYRRYLLDKSHPYSCDCDI
jgi:hypothetical protein